MNSTTFLHLLQECSWKAYQVAQDYLVGELSSNFTYQVLLNASFDGNASSDVTLFPSDNNKQFNNLQEQEVLQLLYRAGKIPVWIDINVVQVTKQSTTLQLLCAGRYTAKDQQLYYYNRGTGPFAIKSPLLPVDYQKGTKFKLIP